MDILWHYLLAQEFGVYYATDYSAQEQWARVKFLDVEVSSKLCFSGPID